MTETANRSSVSSLFSDEEKAYIDVVAATSDTSDGGLWMKVLSNLTFFAPSIVIGCLGL